ncbi:MAG: hypothetical protein A2167_02315 [Planctomycetes bacterium RBG_13_46_10]|nr:MAG: hypothetical protein A2167_02315 [Planctomycetes bacterium RBG_13_46_10]
MNIIYLKCFSCANYQNCANTSVDSARYRRIRDEHCSTIVENVLQIGLFLQNKANFCTAKINISSFVTSE